MQVTREQAAAAVSAPLMVIGLMAVAIAADWPVRLGGIAMVAGASAALAVTGRASRRMAWTLAALGVTAVLVGCF